MKLLTLLLASVSFGSLLTLAATPVKSKAKAGAVVADLEVLAGDLTKSIVQNGTEILTDLQDVISGATDLAAGKPTGVVSLAHGLSGIGHILLPPLEKAFKSSNSTKNGTTAVTTGVPASTMVSDAAGNTTTSTVVTDFEEVWLTFWELVLQNGTQLLTDVQDIIAGGKDVVAGKPSGAVQMAMGLNDAAHILIPPLAYTVHSIASNASSPHTTTSGMNESTSSAGPMAPSPPINSASPLPTSTVLPTNDTATPATSKPGIGTDLRVIAKTFGQELLQNGTDILSAISEIVTGAGEVAVGDPLGLIALAKGVVDLGETILPPLIHAVQSIQASNGTAVASSSSMMEGPTGTGAAGAGGSGGYGGVATATITNVVQSAGSGNVGTTLSHSGASRSVAPLLFAVAFACI